MSKSEKSAFFLHIFANNFLVHFFKTFLTDSKSAWNSAFFDTFVDNSKKNFCYVILVLFQTLTANAQETAQKNGKSFFMNVS